MRNENDRMVQAAQSDDIRHEIAQMRESVELARSDIRRTKGDVQRFQDEHESHVRRTRALWAIVILLIAGSAGLWWYGSSLVKEHQGLVGKMPVLQSALDNVNTKVSSAGQQLNAWAEDQLGFSNRVAKIETAVSSNMKAIGSQTRTLTQQMQALSQQLRSELDQSLKSLQSRVSGVESIQREHAEEVTRLQKEIAGVRQELAAVREENTSQISRISQIEQAHQSTRNDLNSVDRRVSVNQTAINGLASQVDRQRITFTLPVGRTLQVADGIYLTVNHINVERQQVDGWVQIAHEGRIVWLHEAGAQKPIEFATKADSRAYQLVFTGIQRNDTAGYLLAPLTAREAPGAAANN
jgi:chromosome segregation ATPase